MEKEVLFSRMKKWNCNLEEALERMMGDEEALAEILFSAIEGFEVGKLSNLLDADDFNGALDVAHERKGVFANLGITPAFELMSEVCNNIRSENFTHAKELVPAIEEMEAELLKLFK